jgi:hypothetical protein
VTFFCFRRSGTLSAGSEEPRLLLKAEVLTNPKVFNDELRLELPDGTIA